MNRINYKIVTVILFFISTAFSFTLQPQLKKRADTVICMLISGEYAQVITCTDSLMSVDSTEPLYPYLHLCALGLRDLDFDHIIDTNAFLASYQKTIKTLNLYEKEHGKTSYSMTLLGFAYASHSSFYLMRKKYFSAIGTGLDAMKIFNEAKESDSTNYDVDLFLGLYNYARGELKKTLWMVLFWYPGSKKQGIRSLESCKNNSLLASEGAKLVLLDIYARESQFEKFKILAGSLFIKYPTSKFLYWSRARYFEALKEYAKAADDYGELAESYEREKYGDFNSLVTRLKQIELLDKSGQGKEAIRIAREVLDEEKCNVSKRNAKICKDIKRFIKD